MTRQASHLYGLLSFLDPLLGRPPLVIEPYHRPARRSQVRHDEPRSREQLHGMELHLRRDLSCRLPTRRLIQKALVPPVFVTRTPHRARQKFFNVAHQVVIRRKPNRIFHSPFFHRFVDLRFGKRGIGPKHHFFTPFLLPFDFWQKHFLPVLGAMHVARPQLRSLVRSRHSGMNVSPRTAVPLGPAATVSRSRSTAA